MLVLSRRVGERVVLPDCEVTITVVRMAGNKVRLGFEAPARIRVHREEICRAVEEELRELVAR